jgi:type II secretory pathway component GspD/PulD (secretin)
VLIDTPEKIKEMESVIAETDISTVSRVFPTETKTFAIQYADVEFIQQQIESLVTREIGSIRADKRTKNLIVTALPHNMEKVEHLINLFDQRQKQVFIEAKIIEVVLSDTFNLGINWQHVFQRLDPRFSFETVSKTGIINPPGANIGGVDVPGATVSYNTILSGGDLTAVLNAMKSIGETKILSNPQIAVEDGKEATIKVVEKQPYKEIQMESGTTNITGVTYLFLEVGVVLSVTPKINEADFISVDIKPEISSISEWYDGDPQEGTPVVKTAFAETSVTVKDGVTLIIGGMIKDRNDMATTEIPFLSSIPFLGRLFTSESIVTRNTETVVFLTPRIISGEESVLRMRNMKKKPKPLRPVGTDKEKKFKPIR